MDWIQVAQDVLVVGSSKHGNGPSDEDIKLSGALLHGIIKGQVGLFWV
jgi:hypothetical protein